MPEILQTDYQSISDMDQDEGVASGENFYVIVAGRTNGAPETIVEWLRGVGHTQVFSPQDSDYLLIFCPVASRVGTDISDALQNIPASGKKFYVIVTGRTNGAHETIVQKFRRVGHTEVSSPQDSDYLLVFCPVASQVGTDISEALQNIPAGKPVILVVMHHTFNPDHIIADSRRQVDKDNVRLTVDCLFYEDKLLTSKRNDIAWSEIQKFLRVPVFSVLQRLLAVRQGFSSLSFSWQPNASWKKFYVIVAGRTNGAHETIVEWLRVSHTEVFSPQDSDYLLIFCPVASQVGTDISEALQNIPAGKPVILVVMHHTFNPDHIVADSRRQVDNSNVRLTVDCLFYEGRLLTSKRNRNAWSKIQKFLRVPVFPVSVPPSGGGDQKESNKTQTLSQVSVPPSGTSWKKFYVIVAGRTNGAHETIVEWLRVSHTEVFSPQDSDYLLIFCRVASQVGTDISEALQNIPAGKPVILVVMHHTFNPHHVVADSRRQVDNSNVCLTVDCLFHEDKLLTSKRNDIAWSEIQKFLRVPVFPVSVPPSGASGKKFHVIVAGRTNGAHETIVQRICRVSHTEVFSPQDSDYLLVFCRVASQVGTDISEALQNIPAGKPAVLVVMHHTSNPNHVVADSRRQVDNSNVCLTVDCLFHEDKLLTSKRNDIAWSEIQRVIQLPDFPVSLPALGGPWKKFYVIMAGRTNGAHETIVEMIRRIGHAEVSSPDDSDYLLIFCPTASQVGTDISEALQNIPAGKPAVLVVIHHTFNPDYFVADSRRQVDNPNVRLTVDCLFYECRLLHSDHSEIQK